MKKLLLLLTLVIVLLSTSKANINFALDYVAFQAIGEKPYLELYLSINGNSVSYVETKKDLFQAKIEITYLFEKGGQVETFKKFQLNSPEYSVESNKLDLIDLKRIPLENGTYSLSIIIEDLTNAAKIEKTIDLRPIDFPTDKINLSEIELANAVNAVTVESPFVKNGIDITPNIAHVYGKEKNELFFYTEIYHADKTLKKDEDYLIEYKIVNKDTREITANLRAIKRSKANEITPVVNSFSLDKLPTDFYSLVVNIINRDNEVIASKSTDFFRSNPNLTDFSALLIQNTFVDSMNNKQELTEYIKSLRPIANDDEQRHGNNQVELADLNYMKKYFYNFWKVRNALDPERAWIEYKEKVELVDREFGYANIKGYQTERGRVYLQYGPPNSVQDIPYDRDTYPYSIWQYYKLQGLTDRRIIFYSPSMEMLGYQILHSNVRGEVYNPGWEADLISKTNGNRRGVQDEQEKGSYNENARSLFDNPR